MIRASISNLSRNIHISRTINHKLRWNQSTLLDKFLSHPYSRLCRYEKPIGCMLLYWPTTWGLAIGAATVPCNYKLIQL